ncbi:MULTISPECIES: isochorismatase family protein [Modicisalibacter]|uniref:isochorismatase family protein n=1 Tax=Modicisalibacter TaxID=574347 RepID=UPI001396BEA2|nr:MULTISPECIES: isochorismatase family protein [Halomonadaceae]MBZ9560182.1 isochorismatase family protein [Modicisalibacter sp. R2A 31.J]MBZ9576090.1 isochorismatase family protein [Modicisalibacter sp. MOD 31.J]
MPFSHGAAHLRPADARDGGTALVLIDVQRGIDDTAYWGRRNNPALEDHLSELLACWRGGDGLVTHVRHHARLHASPLYPGNAGAAFKPCVMPHEGERIVTKYVESAFVGTGLETWLRRHGVSRLVVAGVATSRAVNATATHAACLDFAVTIVEDACADFELTDRHGTHWSAEAVHEFGMVLLDAHCGNVLSTHDVIRLF